MTRGLNWALFSTTLAFGALAWYESVLVKQLSSERLHSDEQDPLRKRLSDAEKAVRQAQDQIALENSPARSDAAKAKRNGPGNRARIEALSTDPEFLRLRALQLRGELDGRYAALFKSLGLPPDKLEKLKDLLVERRQMLSDAANLSQDPGGGAAAITQAEASVDAEIKADLGDDASAAVQRYVQTFPERNVAEQLQTALSYTGTPLSDADREKLIGVLAASASPEDSPAAGGDPASTAFALRTALGAYDSTLTDQAVQAASSMLSPPQVAALQQLQQAQQATRKLDELTTAAQKAAQAATAAAQP